MAKITRKTAQIFGFNGPAGPNGVAQFGSFAVSAPVFSLDPTVIQGLSAWKNGWNAAIVAGDLPALEDMNAVEYVSSYQAAYILEMGVPEWDAGTTYYINSIVQSNGVLYQSITDNNLGNAVTSNTNWKLLPTGTVRGENMFRNAAFQVLQRGTSGTIVAGSPVYTADGWILGCTGVNMPWAVANTTPYPGVGAGSNMMTLNGSVGLTDAFVKQRVESLITATLPGAARLTVQLYVANGTGAPLTPKLTVNYPTVVDDYSSVTNVVNAASMTTVPTSGSAVVAYTFDTTGLQYTNGMEFIIDFGTSLNGAARFLSFTNLDVCLTPTLNDGIQTSAPLSQIRPIGVEMPFNDRYFQSMGGSDPNEPFVSGFSFDTSLNTMTIDLKTVMRVKPAVGISAVGDFSLAVPGSSRAVSSITLGIGGTSVVVLNVVASTPVTAGQGCYLEAINSNARLTFSAEI